MIMGQPINVVFTRSSKPGIYRFEVNRCLTGMDHERFRVDDDIIGDTPSDELARRLSVSYTHMTLPTICSV